MRRNQPTSGMSLLEVLIASTIMVTAVAGVFEALTATKHLSSNATTKDELESEADTIMRTVSADLNLSGWHLPGSEDFNRSTTLDAGEDLNDNTVLDTITYTGHTKALDRDAWYYPYVQIQASAPGDRFRHTHRPASAYQLPTLPAVIPGDPADATTLFDTNEAGWLASFHAQSQEIVFLKATVGHWDAAADSYSFRKQTASYAAAATSGTDRQTLNFDGTRAAWMTANNHAALGVLYPSGWAPVTDVGGNITGYTEREAGLPYGVVLDAGWYDLDAEATDEDAYIKVQWETLDTPVYSMADYAPDRLREYTYAVVPSPLGFGRLVRAVKVRQAAVATVSTGFEMGELLPSSTTTAYRMQIDRVLSDDVVRILFDTYRTVDGSGAEVTTLSPNQVRVRLYLARRQLTNPDVIISRVFESVIGMRARSSATEVNAVTTILGTGPVGLAR